MAGAPPPSEPKSLGKLPYDLQLTIMSLIPCSVDRGLTMSLVCREWRDVIRRHRDLPFRFPKLPWLLLTAFSDGSTRVACVLGGCPRIHRYLTVDPPGARVFGSHPGGWLLLHYRDGGEARGNRAHNVRDGAVERLPAELLVSDGRRFPDMVVFAAALSSPPNDARCVAAALVAVPVRGGRRLCVAFWRKGWGLAREEAPPEADDVALAVEHVVFHDGAFHMITQGNHIRVCTPTIEVEDDDDGLLLTWNTRRFENGDILRDQYVQAQYLVVSRGELLLVLRFTPHPDQLTTKFKVYREAAEDKYPRVWRELDTLEGRMLFVGQGCTRSYEVGQYPGCNCKEGIYFMDDEPSQVVQVIFGVGDVRRYPCMDNGRWSHEDGIHNCFPMPHPSEHSPSAWLLL